MVGYSGMIANDTGEIENGSGETAGYIGARRNYSGETAAHIGEMPDSSNEIADYFRAERCFSDPNPGCSGENSDYLRAGRCFADEIELTAVDYNNSSDRFQGLPEGFQVIRADRAVDDAGIEDT